MRGVAVACPLSGIVRLQAAVGRALTGTRWGLCHFISEFVGLMIEILNLILLTAEELVSSRPPAACAPFAANNPGCAA